MLPVRRWQSAAHGSDGGAAAAAVAQLHCGRRLAALERERARARGAVERERSGGQRAQGAKGRYRGRVAVGRVSRWSRGGAQVLRQPAPDSNIPYLGSRHFGRHRRPSSTRIAALLRVRAGPPRNQEVVCTLAPRWNAWAALAARPAVSLLRIRRPNALAAPTPPAAHPGRPSHQYASKPRPRRPAKPHRQGRDARRCSRASADRNRVISIRSAQMAGQRMAGWATQTSSSRCASRWSS
jgi:hypothetical protein